MPAVSTDTSGDHPRATLVRWHRPDEATVAVGEPLCELETDKATVDVPAWAAGILRLLARIGDTVTVGDEIARIDPPP